MILYDAGDYHLGFIWSLQGSTLPKACLFGLPSAFMSLAWILLQEEYPDQIQFYVNLNVSASWAILTVVLGMLLSFRTNKAYARFWEGTTLVQQMRAEWFEACSNLMAFSKMAILKDPTNPEVRKRSTTFGFTLVRLVSLMHGAALRQVTGGDGEEFDVLDVGGIDEESLDYLQVDCAIDEVNRVEVLLHWVQVLITDSIHEGILVTPPPILTRSYQTLSRGMVNLHNVRKLADVPFPFPLSQMLSVLLLIQSFLTPIFVSQLKVGLCGAFVLSFMPTFGMWSLMFISGELEQPFGQDPNDLPLCELQYEMNNSLLMLLDERAQRAPTLKAEAIMDLSELRANLGESNSTTQILGSVEAEEREQRIMRGSGRKLSRAEVGKVKSVIVQDVPSTATVGQGDAAPQERELLVFLNDEQAMALHKTSLVETQSSVCEVRSMSQDTSFTDEANECHGVKDDSRLPPHVTEKGGFPAAPNDHVVLLDESKFRSPSGHVVDQDELRNHITLPTVPEAEASEPPPHPSARCSLKNCLPLCATESSQGDSISGCHADTGPHAVTPRCLRESPSVLSSRRYGSSMLDHKDSVRPPDPLFGHDPVPTPPETPTFLEQMTPGTPAKVRKQSAKTRNDRPPRDESGPQKRFVDGRVRSSSQVGVDTGTACVAESATDAVNPLVLL
eukprot:TRINITY_DN6808_c0_g1_i1.p1 TRINITY_DN6808_c0_g1~~TRINITY_DN6808_c0_g1_i1.p1  ORF type:complete len:673 (+),score=59.94 TRINITY_DN6808_c0_g1_i1:101-2119(+)